MGQRGANNRCGGEVVRQREGQKEDMRGERWENEQKGIQGVKEGKEGRYITVRGCRGSDLGWAWI